MTRRWGRDPFRTGVAHAVEDAARQALAASTAPGLAAALVQHVQVVWAAGYGLAVRTTGQPVTAWGVLRLLSHTAGLSVHGYVGQPSDRPLPPIAASLSGETGDSFPGELLEPPGRGWRYSGGGYSLRQLLPDRRAAIAVLANGDDGNAPIDAVVQQWLGLATPNPKRARGRIAVLGALAVVAVVATATRWRRRRGPRGRAGAGMEPRRPAW